MVARLLVCLALAAAPAWAGVDRLEVFSFDRREVFAVEAGWYPVFVAFHYTGEAGEGRVRVTNARQRSSWSVPVQLTHAAARTVTVYCHQRRPARPDPLHVALLLGERVLAERTLEVKPLETKKLRILLLGHPNLQRFADPGRLAALRPSAVVHHPPDLPLPDRVEGYDPFQLILACGYPLASLRPPEQEALRGWVQSGGELVVAADSAAGRPAGPFADSLLPIGPGSEVRLPDLEPLARFCGLPPRSRSGGPLRAFGGDLVRGEALLGDNRRALLASAPLGLGRVHWCGFDLSRPPLVDWEERECLLWRLAGLVPGHPPLPAFAGPVRAFLHQMPAPQVLLWVALFLGLYLAALGGGAWLALRWRGTRRPLWLLPALAGAFAAAAPGASRLLTDLRSQWQSLTLRWQPEGGRVAAERTFLMAYTPGVSRQRVELASRDLATLVAAGPEAPDEPREEGVQGERPHLLGVDFFLGGRTFLAARRLLAVSPVRGSVELSGRAGGYDVQGRMDGDLARYDSRLMVVVGERAGLVALSRRADGRQGIAASLSLSPEEAFSAIARRAGWSPGGPAGWRLPLPPGHGSWAHLVALDEALAPVEPLARWNGVRHLLVWVVRLPLVLPRRGPREVCVPAALVPEAETRSLSLYGGPVAAYRELERTFVLPPFAAAARRVELEIELAAYHPWVPKPAPVSLRIYRPATGAWEELKDPRAPVTDGKAYLDPLGRVRLKVVARAGEGFTLTRLGLAAVIEP